MLDISNAKFAFLDIETTGLTPWFGDRICQIAVVVTEGKRIKSTVDLLINPERELSPAALQVNKLTDEALTKAPKFKEITDTLDALFENAIVVCHNAKFDIQFLDSEYHRLGRQVEFPNLIDTMLIAQQFYQLPSYSLEHLAEAFQVSTKLPNSRAQADALTAKNIFFAMMDSLKQFNKPLEDFIGIYNSPAWPEEGVYLPIELSEAIRSGKRLFIKYMDKNGEISERWISQVKVQGLSDYLYLQAYCHTREAERTFRLDRILDVAVEVEK
ncbi:MAG: exonuclease domain-containing protein [Anaerolineales bacterium]